MIQRKLWQKTALSSSSWDQSPEAELCELCDSAARQRDLSDQRTSHLYMYLLSGVWQQVGHRNSLN